MIGTLPPDQTAEVLRGLIILALGSIAARPLALRLVPGGGGWIAAVLLAWAVIGWVPWYLSALGVLAFSQGALSGLGVLVLSRFWLNAPSPDPKGGLLTGLSYVGLFWFGLAQRLGHPDLSGLEKFTDTAFVAASLRTDWMPPQDAWFAGASINYYYVGQAMAATWGNLAAAPADHAYQLAMASLFALTGLGVFRLTVALAQSCGRRIATVLGAMAALLSLYGGNFHAPLYSLLRAWMPATNPDYYFPDSTRFIGFDPPTLDKGFTEFPGYAFSVGDLHAHVIATPVFLLGLLTILSILRRGLELQRVDAVHAVAFGWILGLCVAINSWDVAILGLIAVMVALVLLVQRKPHLGLRLDDLGFAAILAIGTAFLTAAPFLGNFTPFATGIERAPAQSPLWQLLVLYGHGLPACALLVALAFRGAAQGVILPIGLLFIASLLLIALPETVIVRDIYGLDYARANTMFKLSFRAQTLLIIASLAALAPAVALGRRWFAAGLVAAVPLVALLAYLPQVFVAPTHIRSLDGLAFLGAERALVKAAGALPLAEGESLIEASGDAFGDTARVSAMTGHPAVMGWAGHEWLWRSDPTGVYRRADAVTAFYGKADIAARCQIIRRFAIRYAIIGEVEHRHYPELDIEAIRALGVVIHSSPGGEIVQLDPNRCPD